MDKTIFNVNIANCTISLERNVTDESLQHQISDIFHINNQIVCFIMCKASEHDNPVVKYVAKVSCLNPMSISGRKWRDCVTIQNEINMVDMNVKNVYKEE